MLPFLGAAEEAGPGDGEAVGRGVAGGRVRGRRGRGHVQRGSRDDRGRPLLLCRQFVQMRGQVARLGAGRGVHLHAQEGGQRLVLLPGRVGPAHGGVQAHQEAV